MPIIHKLIRIRYIKYYQVNLYLVLLKLFKVKTLSMPTNACFHQKNITKITFTLNNLEVYLWITFDVYSHKHILQICLTIAKDLLVPLWLNIQNFYIFCHFSLIYNNNIVNFVLHIVILSQNMLLFMFYLSVC